VLHLGGQYAWVYAIAMLPLATVFAIEFTMPVWTAILATLILGERLNRGRVVMLVLGLAGVLVILKPGFSIVQAAALVMLAGSFAYASMNIATKRLSESDSALAVTSSASRSNSLNSRFKHETISNALIRAVILVKPTTSVKMIEASSK